MSDLSTNGGVNGCWGQGTKARKVEHSECCYGMGFGPEGDGVELAARDDMGFDKLFAAYARMNRRKGSFEGIQWPQWAFEDQPESNAKPALPALTRQAGEKYKGLGFNDGLDQ